MKVAFFAALMLVLSGDRQPAVAVRRAGPLQEEKRALLPFLLATPVLFAWARRSPISSRCRSRCIFLLGYQGDIGGIQQEALPAVGNYLDFVMQFLFGFGIAFLLPVLLMLLERAGIVTRKQLVGAGAMRSSRRSRLRRC